MARQGQVRQYLDPAHPVGLRAGLFGELRTERVRGHTGGPHLAHRFHPFGGAVLAFDGEPARVDLGDHGLGPHLDAAFLQRPAGRAAEVLAEAGQHQGTALDEDHPRLARVDATELADEGLGGQFPDLPGHLHPRRSRADDREGQEPGDVLPLRGEFGQLEGPEDPGPQLQGVVDGLHAGRVAGEVVIAEVRLPRAGGDDQRVVACDLFEAVETPPHLPGLHVDPLDEPKLHRHVLVLAQHLPGCGGDLALRQDSGRHLVEQRLEQMMGGACYQRHIDVGAPQGLRREQTTKTRTDYHNMMLAHIGYCAGRLGIMPSQAHLPDGAWAEHTPPLWLSQHVSLLPETG